MARIVIIGYGNSLRGDDGLGWATIEILERTAYPAEIELWAFHQLLPEHVYTIKDAEQVIFIDAADGDHPGSIQEQSLNPVIPGTESFSHFLTPEKLLGLTLKIFQTAPRGILYTIDGQSFEFKEGLSEPVLNSLPELIRRIEQNLNLFFPTTEPASEPKTSTEY